MELVHVPGDGDALHLIARPADEHARVEAAAIPAPRAARDGYAAAAARPSRSSAT